MNAYEESEELRKRSEAWFANYLATGEIKGTESLAVIKAEPA